MQISSYLSRQIDRYPVPSDEEQLDLIRLAQGGDEDAREALILGNLRLVRHVAQQMTIPAHYELDDLISEGVQGLSYSIDKFDFEKGTKPSTFFWDAIKWKIIKFSESLGDLHLSLNTIIESGDDEHDKCELMDLIPDPYANNLVRQVEAFSDLKHLLCYLPERNQIIIILAEGLFGFEPYGLDDIGFMIGLTHEGVRQVRDRGIAKMGELVDVPPTHKFVRLSKIQELIDDSKILSKREKIFTKRDKKMKFQLKPIEHSYTFGYNKSVPEFLVEFGDRIRSDYANGGSIRCLAKKYNCPRTQINKAIGR